MNIKGILFDMYGTLLDVYTDEGNDELYRVLSNFLTYQGVSIGSGELRDEYFHLMKQQKNDAAENFAEFDAVALWKTFLERRPPQNPTQTKLEQLSVTQAELFRAASRYRLQRYPDETRVLKELHARFPLGAVSDAQSIWLWPEIRALGIAPFFKSVAVSSDYGFRKPDPRLFNKTLNALRLNPDEVLFVGNDMYRDIHGAKELGVKTVFFSSNQGRKSMDGVQPDYIIYNFRELLAAVDFFERQ
jgi:putative hydrolase of the HAD superfamily